MNGKMLPFIILDVRQDITVVATHSTQTRDAVRVLAQQIVAARRGRRRTAADVAERAGISRTTLAKIEHGDPSVAIGTVFEVATLLGVSLFASDRAELASLVARGEERLALLPDRVREPDVEIDDEF